MDSRAVAPVYKYEVPIMPAGLLQYTTEHKWGFYMKLHKVCQDLQYLQMSRMYDYC